MYVDFSLSLQISGVELTLKLKYFLQAETGQDDQRLPPSPQSLLHYQLNHHQSTLNQIVRSVIHHCHSKQSQKSINKVTLISNKSTWPVGI